MITNNFSTFSVMYAETPTRENYETLDIRVTDLDNKQVVKLNPYYLSLDNATLLASSDEAEVLRGIKMYKHSVMYGINKLNEIVK